jgi:hypothetical protein
MCLTADGFQKFYGFLLRNRKEIFFCFFYKVIVPSNSESYKAPQNSLFCPFSTYFNVYRSLAKFYRLTIAVHKIRLVLQRRKKKRRRLVTWGRLGYVALDTYQF